ncbi:MAG: SDR family NAD(P)-dependent oxidoreductase [Bacteroidales bacterium]
MKNEHTSIDNKYALITGAANGLGRAFSEELSKRGINIILVDLPESEVKERADEFKVEYGVDTQCYECDLSEKDNVIELAEVINENFEVFMLINNAGIGGTKRFEAVDAEYISKIIELNVMATSLLTHQILPNLRKQKQGYILNVASMAAFSPIGYKTVYPASKAFVQSFSRGLYEEFKNSNVFVSVVNPGPMKTNADVTKRIIEQGFWGKLGQQTPEKVAKMSIKRLFRHEKTMILSLGNKFNWLLTKTLPTSVCLSFTTNKVKREILRDENKFLQKA